MSRKYLWLKNFTKAVLLSAIINFCLLHLSIFCVVPDVSRILRFSLVCFNDMGHLSLDSLKRLNSISSKINLKVLSILDCWEITPKSNCSLYQKIRLSLCK